MKKIILLAMLLAFYSVSEAQLLRGVGIKAGMTISNQDWDYVPLNVDPDNRVGYNLGVFAEFLDVPFFSVVGELNYIQKGLTNLTGDIFDEVTSDLDIKLNYLNITALAKLRMNYVVLSPYLVAGPKLDIELSRDAGVSNIITDNFKKERLGFKVGVGTEINTPALTFLVELLYDADFNELYDNRDLSINTSSYDIRVGILF